MRKYILLGFIMMSIASFAQSDSIYTYMDSDWKPTVKGSAIYIRKVFKAGNNWCQEDLYAATNKPQMIGFYTDSALKNKTGTWTWLNKEGVITERSVYDNNERIEHSLFYPNGQRRIHVVFNGDKVTAEGWDEKGNEIPGFIYEQAAEFPGGLDAWRNFLVKGITKDQPKDFKKGKISGRVVIDFRIDKEGNVVDVTVSQSSGYAELDEHALNIIRNSPKWQPAIQYNKNVIFRQKQPIIYRLED